VNISVVHKWNSELMTLILQVHIVNMNRQTEIHCIQVTDIVWLAGHFTIKKPLKQSLF